MENRDITIARRELDRHVVLCASGTVDLRTSGDLAAALSDDIDANDSRVLVVDLTDVPFMDSTGLSALVHAGNRLSDAGRALVLVASPGPVRRVLEVSGIDQIFTVEESVDAAISLA